MPPAPDDDPRPQNPDDEPEMYADAQVDERTGQWECLNTAANCTMAAPDARTPGRLFDGPVQSAVTEAVTCPECKGDKVIFRGDKAAAAAA
jgi:hypothetical protein